jgi:predicted dehydrogenase/nucleoside-diphosphate-sugar epimerase
MKLAIIGCGAVTEKCYLPALQQIDGIQTIFLIDKNYLRAKMLASQYNVPYISDNYTDIIGKVDAAIIALPHSLHAPVSIVLLRQGIHVLVEKPMALNQEECKAMISAAEEGNSILAVGLIRRFLYSARWVKAILDNNLLGEIKTFDFREGYVYNWPTVSDSFFRKEIAGGGVLIDTGAHTLDLLLWWLGDFEEFEYYDDNYGNVEANCKLHLILKSGAKGIVELSRVRKLRNTAIIQGSKGKIEVSLCGNHIIAEPKDILNFEVSGIKGSNMPNQSILDLFVLQLKDWINAIKTKTQPFVLGQEGARAIALIEACYRSRKLLSLPWVNVKIKSNFKNCPNLKNKKVLVTGATGFLGGRLVEKLVLEFNAKVKTLVRNFSRASRIARFPIEMVYGDIDNDDAIDRAVQECEIVFHCAHDFSNPQKNIIGTKLLAEACLRHKVNRFVYVSSFSVYEPFQDGDLDESSPMLPCNWEYTNNKRYIEQELLIYAHEKGLPVVILQPTIVYGPFSRTWTDEIVLLLRTGRVVLPDNGDGLCNAVYVDDVVNGLILAAIASDNVIGERFLISSEQPITWLEFFTAYEKILNVKSVILMPIEKILQLISKRPDVLLEVDPRRFMELSLIRIFRKLLRPFIPKSFRKKIRQNLPLPLHLPTMQRLNLYRAKTYVKIDKAKKLLGYEPKFSFEEGMEITAYYIKWANL